MRQTYRLLTLGFVLCGTAAGVGGIIFLRMSHTVDVNAEVGKWLLTLAVALVVTGALSMVVKQIDQRRNERQAWHTILIDLVAANQTVMLARFRIAAHRSALTYHEELAELMRARVELRRICAIGMVIADPPLRGNIAAMQSYLDALGREYEAEYLRVARQQRLDELRLAKQMKAANGNAAMQVIPPSLAEPTRSWCQLQDHSRFPRLAALLDDDAFQIDTFRTNYKRARGCLEMNAGFGNNSTDSSVKSARKLSGRAMSFMTTHTEMPDEVKVCISQGVCRLEDACNDKDPDPLVVEAAAVQLRKATSSAVANVYPVAKHKRDVTSVPL